MLACFYRDGTGVSQNYKKAIILYQKLINQKNAGSIAPKACCALARFYINGWGVSKDKAQAINLYRKAAQSGEAFAIKRLKELGEKVDVSMKAVTQSHTLMPAIESFEELIEQFLSSHPQIHKDQGIFSEKSLAKMYVPFGIPSDEKVLLAHDDSVFKTGQNGFVITGRGIYCRDGWTDPVFTDWRTFSKCKITKERFGMFYLDNGNCFCYCTEAGAIKKALRKFWPDLQIYLQNKLG